MTPDTVVIQDTISRYHQAASLRDWQTTVATFAPDGVWELLRAKRKLVGHDEIKAALITLTAPIEYVVQINAPALIEVDGYKATARSSIRESGKFSGHQVGFEAFGIYHDRLIRTDVGWRFAHRAFETCWLHKVAILDALPGG